MVSNIRWRSWNLFPEAEEGELLNRIVSSMGDVVLRHGLRSQASQAASLTLLLMIQGPRAGRGICDPPWANLQKYAEIKVLKYKSEQGCVLRAPTLREHKHF